MDPETISVTDRDQVSGWSCVPACKTTANLDPGEKVGNIERNLAIHSAGTRYIFQGIQINGLVVRVGCIVSDVVCSEWLQFALMGGRNGSEHDQAKPNV